MSHLSEAVRHMLLHLHSCMASEPASAPASADPAVFNMLNQILKETNTMATDFTRLQGDMTKALAALAQLPALKAQVADLQAKLAAAPHDDPTVQQTVDAMAAALEQALPSDPIPAAPAAPVPADQPPPVDTPPAA